MQQFKTGDNVFHSETGSTGTIDTLYREVNIALIRTDEGLEKARLDDLVKVFAPEPEPEPETKKETLLDKVKGRFSR